MKANLIENRQIRIFISSTFRDMQPERNYLVDRIFPTLKKYCQDRDVTLVELDLRWGISENDSKQGKVVEICLQEIKNTHPFFIGLLGERYGWIPSQEELSRNTQIPEMYPWITSDLSAGRSITEIEMQYGVLRSKKDINAYFYLRSPEMIIPEDFKEEKGSEEERKLSLLKEQICLQDKYPVKNYASIEELGRQVEEDFKQLVDTLFPQGQLSEVEKERLQQKAFLKSRTGVYIPNSDNDKRLDDFIADDSPALVITGESGMGKSALIANWIAANEKTIEGRMIYHFVGNSRLEGDYRKITQRLINEIKWVYGLSDEKDELKALSNTSSSDSDKQKEELEKLLLSIAGKERLLIILDGINQLAEDDNAKLLNWLPVFPINVKVIYSTLSDDTTMNVFKRRGYTVFTLQPLTVEKREELIRVYLNAYSKSLLPNQVRRIASDKKCENTLVLRTLLDELRVFGVHEKIDHRIDYYLSATDIHLFFDKVLTRIESSYNFDDTNFVEDVFSLIAVSRAGLSETELLKLTGAPTLYWVQLYHAMASHLTVKNGLITFSHSYLRESIQQRYLNQGNENTYRSRIVEYCEKELLEKIPIRIYDELPYQLHKLHRHDRLYSFLLNFIIFYYHFYKNIYELGDYWRLLIHENKEKYQLKAYLGLNIDNWEEKAISILYKNIGDFTSELFRDNLLTLEYRMKTLDIQRRVLGTEHPDTANTYNAIGNTYYFMGDYTKAEEYFLKALNIQKRVLGIEHQDIATSYNGIGVIYYSKGEYSKAVEYYMKALTIEEHIKKTEDSSLAGTYNNIGTAYGSMGEYPKALEFKMRALYIFERELGTEHPSTAISYNNIGTTYSSMGDYPKAIEYCLKALDIRERVLGIEHPDTAISYGNIGSVYESMENYQKALEFKMKGLAIDERVLGAEHPDTATSYNNIGSTYESTGNYIKALELKIKALTIREHVLGTEHPDTALSYDNIGSTYESIGDYTKALELKMRALNIRKHIFGTEHPDTASSYNNIGYTYNSMGDYLKPEEYYMKALDIRERVLGTEHADTAKSYNNIGYICNSMGDYPKAMEYYLKALVIRERMLGTEHPDTTAIYDNIKSAYESISHHSNALENYLEILTIHERILGMNHPSTATSYSYIGDTYYSMKDYPEALKYYLKTVDIRERILGTEDPDTIFSYSVIGYTYDSMEDHTKAMEYKMKALDIQESV